MTRQSGAVRIFLYNWPVYVGAWIAALVIVLLVPYLHTSLKWVAVLGAGVAVGWSAISLAISYYIYDKSKLGAGHWVVPLLGQDSKAWATIHAGLDAEVELDGVMPGACIARLDIFDKEVMTSPSITRARLRTPSTKHASACRPSALRLDDQGCDAIVVAFTAHEIRDQGAREAFFGELRRSLRPGGKALIVEHLRDWPNFLAFGPGYLHFVSRSEWLRLAAHARLAIASETRITPWVMALTLERPQ